MTVNPHPAIYLDLPPGLYRATLERSFEDGFGRVWHKFDLVGWGSYLVPNEYMQGVPIVVKYGDTLQLSFGPTEWRDSRVPGKRYGVRFIEAKGLKSC